MKKLFLTLAAAALTLAASAHTLNNPVGADGRYIVKYDCEAGQFAAANDMEVDETFVFAVDVTGTWLENWLKETPTAPGASRGLAINKWTSLGDVDGGTNRMKQISGNIWGMTVNYAQIAVADFTTAMMKDSVLYVYAQIFGFEYTAEDPGAGWWMWADQEVATTQADGADCLFTFAPYTGTKKSYEFYADGFDVDMYGFENKGYAAPGVDLGPVIGIHHTWFAFTGDWTEEHDSHATYDGETLTITNGQSHQARWQGQVFLNLTKALVPGQTYTITAKAKATGNAGALLMKVSDPDAGIGTVEQALSETEVVLTVSGVCPENHSNQIIFDCGFAEAGSVIEISDINIYEVFVDAINNTEAAVNVTKVVEDGQVVIIKNGVRYNVLGATIK